jgi:hypothetical protein
MVLGGIGFGYAVWKAGRIPAWTGALLAVGVVLVSLSQGMPEVAQLLAATVRDLGFLSMGACLLIAAGSERGAAVPTALG